MVVGRWRRSHTMKRTLPYSLSVGTLVLAGAVRLLTHYAHRVRESPTSDDVTVPTELVSSITDPTDHTTSKPAVSDVPDIEKPSEASLTPLDPNQIRSDGWRISPPQQDAPSRAR